MLKNNLDSRVLGFIKLLIQNKERVSVRKVAKGVGYEHSIRMVHLSIHRLLNDKKIVRNSLGEIELLNTKIDTIKIPLKNIDTKGVFIIEDFIRISTKIVNGSEDYFLFKYKGESINDIIINNGDLLLIKETKILNNGDVVFLFIENKISLEKINIEINSISSTLGNRTIKGVLLVNFGQI